MAYFTRRAAEQIQDTVRRVQAMPQTGGQGGPINFSAGHTSHCSVEITADVAAKGKGKGKRRVFDKSAEAWSTVGEEFDIYSNNAVSGKTGSKGQVWAEGGVWVLIQCDRTC